MNAIPPKHYPVIHPTAKGQLELFTAKE